MHSLRSRLLVGIVGGMILLLTIFSLIIYTLIHRALVNQFDASLLSTTRMLAASVEQDKEEVDLEASVQDMPEFQRAEHPIYYQLWKDDGTVIARSPSLGTDDLLRFEGSLDEPVFQEFKTKNGRPGRAIGLKFKPQIADRDENSYRQPAKVQALTLVVAQDASDLQSDLRFLRWLLSAASGSIIIMSVFIATFVVRQGLIPLNSIAAEIAVIKDDNLGARIGTGGVPNEVVPIKNRLNELLSRLEDSFNRERRFTADVAHELRTPLSGLRSTLEVTLSRIRDVKEYETSLCDCLKITNDMQKMVNNLLTLTRIDAHQISFRRVRIQLAEFIDSCWRPFSDKAIEHEIAFDNQLSDEIACETDPDYLSIAISNLFDNAVEYTNEKGRIWANGRQVDGTVEITIGNTGCKLTKEQASQVFDCFWRGDESRTATGTHCGLGLVLVQRIVQALGGSTAVNVQTGGIFIIRLVLPN